MKYCRRQWMKCMCYTTIHILCIWCQTVLCIFLLLWHICRCSATWAGDMFDYYWKENARTVASSEHCPVTSLSAGFPRCFQPLCSWIIPRWHRWYVLSISSGFVFVALLQLLVFVWSALFWYILQVSLGLQRRPFRIDGAGFSWAFAVAKTAESKQSISVVMKGSPFGVVW